MDYSFTKSLDVEMPLLIFKALGILGFPSFQSLDLIEYEQVCSAFLNKLMTVMKNRKQAMMKAQEDRNKPKSQIQIQSRLRREKSWRVDVVMINEAFQVQSIHNPQFSSAVGWKKKATAGIKAPARGEEGGRPRGHRRPPRGSPPILGEACHPEARKPPPPLARRRGGPSRLSR